MIIFYHNARFILFLSATHSASLNGIARLINYINKTGCSKAVNHLPVWRELKTEDCLQFSNHVLLAQRRSLPLYFKTRHRCTS